MNRVLDMNLSDSFLEMGKILSALQYAQLDLLEEVNNLKKFLQDNE